MRQAENRAEVTGVLNQVNLTNAVYNGMPVIRGDVEIAVPYEGTDQMYIIPISVYAGETTKAGTPNSSYQGLRTLQEQYKSIAITGSAETADKITIGLGSISMNEFGTSQGTIVSQPRVSSNFFNRVNPGDYIPRADFKVTIVIGQIVEELDKDGDETGRLVVNGILPQYGGKVDLIPFYVEDKEAINFIKNRWTAGKTVMIQGKINFKLVRTREEIETGFGAPIYNEKTKSVKEFILTSASIDFLEPGEGGYEESEIAEALKARQARREEMKKNAQNRQSNQNTATTAGTAAFTDSDLDF